MTSHILPTALAALEGQNALAQARIVRAGKSPAFGEIDIRGATGG